MWAAHIWDVLNLPSLRFTSLIGQDGNLLFVSSFILSMFYFSPSLFLYLFSPQTVHIPFEFFCLLFPSSFHCNYTIVQGCVVELGTFPAIGRWIIWHKTMILQEPTQKSQGTPGVWVHLGSIILGSFGPFSGLSPAPPPPEQ